jgi:hypothetical protein
MAPPPVSRQSIALREKGLTTPKEGTTGKPFPKHSLWKLTNRKPFINMKGFELYKAVV